MIYSRTFANFVECFQAMNDRIETSVVRRRQAPLKLVIESLVPWNGAKIGGAVLSKGHGSVAVVMTLIAGARYLICSGIVAV